MARAINLYVSIHLLERLSSEATDPERTSARRWVFNLRTNIYFNFVWSIDRDIFIATMNSIVVKSTKKVISK